MDMTTDGVAWTPLASGHIASFDRRKCKGPLNGPQAADGKLCPGRLDRSIKMPGPQFKGVDDLGQREPRVLPVGRSLQHARPRATTCRSPRRTAASR